MIAISLLLIGVCFAAYVLFGYPLLLKFLSKHNANPIRPGLSKRSVSVLIPAHNGGRFLSEKLSSILEQNYPSELVEIIVISDGSTDDTDESVQEFAGRGVRLIRIPRSGKPAALQVGIKASHNEILLLTDVRQTLDKDCIGRLVGCFDDPWVGVASGELLIRSGDTQEEVDIGLYWRFESWIRRQLAKIDSIFGATGPIYAIRRSLAEGVKIPNDILLDDVYLPLTAFLKGYRLVVEESARAYDHPTTLGSEFRRKVRTLAGNYQIIQFMPQLLGPDNRMWIHFVSYKLGRLLLPWALVLIAVSSFLLPSPWARILVLSQVAFWSLAALDQWLPQGFPLKRLSSPVRTFSVMMIAAICALQVFFVPAQELWRDSTIVPRAVPERHVPAAPVVTPAKAFSATASQSK